LKAEPPNTTDRALLGNIIRDDNRAAKLVANLRGLLKKQNSAELQEFDLGEVIRDALEIVAPDAARRGIEVAGCTAHAALLVRGDRIQLQQVILNVAMNAIDALSSCDCTRKKMSINAAAVPGFAVAVSVAANGVGIPPETGPEFRFILPLAQMATGADDASAASWPGDGISLSLGEVLAAAGPVAPDGRLPASKQCFARHGHAGRHCQTAFA